MSAEEPADPSRRALLGSAGALAAGAALLAGCGSASKHRTSTTTTPQSTSSDVRHLNRLLDLEYFVAAAYTAATPLLHGRLHAAGKRFLGQELAHISSLISLVHRANGKPHEAQPGYALGHPRDLADVLALLDQAERTAIAGYLEAIPQISTGSARSTLASILANDAQHVSILRIARRRTPVPAPFLTARE